MSAKYLIRLFFIIAVIFALSTGVGGTDMAGKEKRLQDAAGEEKLDLLVDMAKFYRYRDVKKVIKYGKEALTLLDQFPDTKRRLFFLNNLSQAYSKMSNHKDARKTAESARLLAIKSGDREEHAQALLNFAHLSLNLGAYDRALKESSHALEIFKMLRHKNGQASSYLRIGSIYYKIGDFDHALENFLAAVKILEESRDREPTAYVYNSLGAVYFARRDYKNALNYFNKTLEIWKKLNNKRGIAQITHNISLVHFNQKNYSKALEGAVAALEARKELGEPRSVSNTLSTLGLIYNAMESREEALEHFKKALELSKKINEPEQITTILIYISQIKQITGKYDEALAYLEQALEISTKFKLKDDERDAAEEMYKIYELKKNYRKALEFHVRYKKLADKITNEKKNKKMANLQARYDLQKKESEIALLQKDKALQQNIKNYFIIISVLVLMVAVMIYTRYRLKARVNRSLAVEIEERERTAAQLRVSEQKFRDVAEKSVAGISIIQDNKIKYCNPRYQEIFKYSYEELTGRSSLDLILPEDREYIVGLLAKRQAGEIEASHYNFRGVDKYGKTIYIASYGSQTMYEGRPAAQATIIDVTEQKKAEAELLKSHKLEAVGILAGGIAHDFNNLLTIITGYMDMIKENVTGDSGTVKMVEKVEKAVKQATGLANRFISFSKSGWIVTEKLHFKDIIKSTADRHPRVERLLNNVSIPADLHPVYGDLRQLGEVMFNLINNAGESLSDPDCVTPGCLTIQAENIAVPVENPFSLTGGKYVKVSVKDSGRGIPEDQMKYIFDPYYSTKDDVTEKGLGLGLAICYSVIKKHNGYISVASSVGEGTTVEFYLPAFRPG